MRTASTTSLMIVHGALPVNRCERVRGCTVMASTPSASAIWATSTAFRCSSSQPPRILTVNGTESAFFSARRISAVPVTSRISAAPLPLPVILGMGHPMLRSTMSAPEDLAALGRAREQVGVLAEELHRERPLLRIVGGDGIGMGMVREERRGVHLLRGGEAAAAFPHDQPERRIGDARHGRHARERAHLDGTDLHGPEYTKRHGPSRFARWAGREPAGTEPGGGVLSKV